MSGVVSRWTAGLVVAACVVGVGAPATPAPVAVAAAQKAAALAPQDGPGLDTLVHLLALQGDLPGGK